MLLLFFPSFQFQFSKLHPTSSSGPSCLSVIFLASDDVVHVLSLYYCYSVKKQSLSLRLVESLTLDSVVLFSWEIYILVYPSLEILMSFERTGSKIEGYFRSVILMCLLVVVDQRREIQQQLHLLHQSSLPFHVSSSLQKGQSFLDSQSNTWIYLRSLLPSWNTSRRCWCRHSLGYSNGYFTLNFCCWIRRTSFFCAKKLYLSLRTWASCWLFQDSFQSLFRVNWMNNQFSFEVKSVDAQPAPHSDLKTWDSAAETTAKIYLGDDRQGVSRNSFLLRKGRQQLNNNNRLQSRGKLTTDFTSRIFFSLPVASNAMSLQMHFQCLSVLLFKSWLTLLIKTLLFTSRKASRWLEELLYIGFSWRRSHPLPTTSGSRVNVTLLRLRVLQAETLESLTSYHPNHSQSRNHQHLRLHLPLLLRRMPLPKNFSGRLFVNSVLLKENCRSL